MLLSTHQIMGQICCILREEHKLQPDRAGVADARSPSRQHGRHGIKIRFVLRIPKKYTSPRLTKYINGDGTGVFHPNGQVPLPSACTFWSKGQRLQRFRKRRREGKIMSSSASEPSPTAGRLSSGCLSPLPTTPSCRIRL